MEVIISFVTSILTIENLAIATSVIGVFAMIASRTANKSDDRIAQVLLDIINFLGMNFGKAKNSD